MSSDQEQSRGGQPSIADKYGESTTRTNVTLTESQRQYLLDTYYGIANGVRILIDRDMQRTARRREDD